MDLVQCPGSPSHQCGVADCAKGSPCLVSVDENREGVGLVSSGKLRLLFSNIIT